MIPARSKDDLSSIMRMLGKAENVKGIYINETNTKNMEWTDRKHTQGRYLTLIAAEGTIY